jgi:hypothetical protein
MKRTHSETENDEGVKETDKAPESKRRKTTSCKGKTQSSKKRTEGRKDEEKRDREEKRRKKKDKKLEEKQKKHVEGRKQCDSSNNGIKKKKDSQKRPPKNKDVTVLPQNLPSTDKSSACQPQSATKVEAASKKPTSASPASSKKTVANNKPSQTIMNKLQVQISETGQPRSRLNSSHQAASKPAARTSGGLFAGRSSIDLSDSDSPMTQVMMNLLQPLSLCSH